MDFHADINTIIAVASLVLAIVAMRRQLQGEDRTERDDVKIRLVKVEEFVAILRTIISLKLAPLVKAPTHLIMDALIDKMAQGSLTPEETVQLDICLKEREADQSSKPLTKDERLALAFTQAEVKLRLLSLEWNAKQERDNEERRKKEWKIIRLLRLYLT